MEQRHLGRSGLRISRIGLGTASWGRQVDQHEAGEQLRAFLDAGGTFVDTADVYGHGESERIIGALLAEVVDREELVLASKAGVVDSDRGTDSSRRHLLRALDQTLARLGTDHVDLWHLHHWDPHTPFEETLAACDDAVGSGRARYVAVSNYSGWQTATLAAWQRASGNSAAQLVATQVEYSLLRRDPEREVFPAAATHGLGVLAWGPLGRGVLTGKYRGGGMPAESRAATPQLEPYVRPYLGEEHSRVVNSVVTAAEGLDTTPLQVALAWVRDRPGVASAVVGARTATQLRASLQAEEITLPEEIRRALDDVSAFTA
ncbi:MAG: aldo/keto reductase [Streptosporangiales bacterium]|nr:aldo/keto reductase [Streptosporangiales bacterium]